MNEERTLAVGEIGYLQIPATDAMRAAGFYEKVFGWEIERPHSSFTAPGMIGNFDSERTASSDAGPLLWLYVDNVAATIAAANTAGGSVLQQPMTDSHGPRILATIVDTEGNAIGIFSYGRSAPGKATKQ